jgi:nucleotide-binding universal stress UspA family protein
MLAATDGSAGAAQALRWASAVAQRVGAEVIVTSACMPVDSELPPERVERIAAEHARLLDGWSQPARAAGVEVSTVVTWGDPRERILELAGAEEVDLIVVGRAGSSSGPGVLRLASTTEYLAHHADRPLAVVGGQVTPSPTRILLGVDGSAGSRAAVQWVAAWAPPMGAEVVAVAVAQPVLEWTRSDSPRNWRRTLEQQVRDHWTTELARAGVEPAIQAVRGSKPADRLLQLARAERADLVVLGMRGLGGFTGLRVGRTALRALHRADRPVVLVPASWSQRPLRPSGSRETALSTAGAGGQR